MRRRPELLAPAGDLAAGLAALHYGADAVYLGLKEFSARAEAVNFTPADLARFVSYAHSLVPRRAVYLALNTLVREAELDALAESLYGAAEAEVDALIVQDLGVAALARRFFPHIPLHASTQLAIHNLDGAKAARDLGFTRVTLARELGLAEVGRITAAAGVATEVFIHGALCFSYSGLCLCSSLRTGRSGNRGGCLYPCRLAWRQAAGMDSGHFLSLKDLALGPLVGELSRLGVSSLKIEGRKKKPLYVAATVDYYRRLLDGTISPAEVAVAQDTLQSIFARPWTDFYLRDSRAKGVVEPGRVGHRGAPLGQVERVQRPPGGGWEIVFTPRLGLELHDGIQYPEPGEENWPGFAVEKIRPLTAGKGAGKCYAVPAGTRVAVSWPATATPPVTGLPLYLASSQAVKRAFPCPSPDLPVPRQPLDLALTFLPGEKAASCQVVARGSQKRRQLFRRENGTEPAEDNLTLELTSDCPAFPARERQGVETAVRVAMERLGNSPFRLAGWSFSNPAGLFVRPGELNSLRRELVGRLQVADLDKRLGDLRELRQLFQDAPETRAKRLEEGENWGLAVSEPGLLADFTAGDWEGVAEVVVDIPRPAGLAAWSEALSELAAKIGREKLRLAFPLILRDYPTPDLPLGELLAQGWRRWLLPSLASWRCLRQATGQDGPETALDLAADWPLYVLNHWAARELERLGFSSITLSPEGEGKDFRNLLGAVGAREGLATWVVVEAAFPLFISAVCLHRELGLCPTGGRPGPEGCRAEVLPLSDAMGGEVQVYPTGCGSRVIARDDYSLVSRLAELSSWGGRYFRVDLRGRERTPGEALVLWRKARAGLAGLGGEANFSRGLT